MKHQHAIRAAENRYQWGRYATARYLAKHGVTMRLYRLACVQARDHATRANTERRKLKCIDLQRHRRVT